MGSGGGSPPAPPAMSAEEKDLLKKQTALLDQMNTIYGQGVASSTEQQDLLKRISGLYTVGSDGKLALDQGAVDSQTAMAKMQMDRYQKALAGTLPVSEGTTQRKADEFRLLKENAARRGISISGDSLDNASSDSTAGASLLGQFKRSYGLIEDAERRGELAGATNSGLSMLGASNAAGPANMLGAGGGILGGYSQIAQPYANQRQMEYQGSLAQFGYGQQKRGGVLGAGLGGAMVGAKFGPWGAGIGGAAGLLAGIGS